MRTLTTIDDARQVVRDWTERYTVQPTDEQIDAAARALVRYLGGYGADAEAEEDDDGNSVTDGFDLDGALDAAYDGA